MRAIALLVLLAGCGARGPTWPAKTGTWTAPLVDAWRPDRLLVEARVQGVGPFLFAVDPTVEGATLSAPLAALLKVEGAGDPARGPRARVAFTLGDLALTDVPTTLVDVPEVDRFFERPVVGVLGDALLRGGALEVDRSRGLLVLHRGPVDAPPGARVEPAAGARLEVEVAGETTRCRLALAAPVALLPPAEAEARDLEPVQEAPRGRTGTRPIAWRAPTLLAGHVAETLFVAGEDTVCTLPMLGRRSFRLDAVEDLFWWWPSSGAAWLQRHPDQPPLRLVGRVTRTAPGRVWLAFEPPAEVLPQRYWWRVDLGVEGRPFTVLVQLHPRPGRPLTATVEDAALDPAWLRAPGEPVTTVDLVPIERLCVGDVCLLTDGG